MRIFVRYQIRKHKKDMLKISLNIDQTLWLFSDPHFGHSNLVKGITKWRNKTTGAVPDNVRNFDTLEQMNDVIVNNINNKIKQDDIAICLGDWSFGGFENIQKFRDRVICKNVYLITGNHDEHIVKNRNNIRDIFTQVIEFYTQLEVTHATPHYNGGKWVDKFILCHFPIASWEDMAKGRIQLHGHVHLPPHHRVNQGKAMDVGMDGNNMFPISLQEINSIMGKQPIKPLVLPSDHHADEWVEVKNK